MAANNASGIYSVKYGGTRDHVRAATVVTGTGEVLRLGNRARKSASGYHLLGLVVGSEGTLAIVTELTLALAGLPQARRQGGFRFPDASAAARATAELIRFGADVAAVEFLDGRTVAALNRFGQFGLAETPTLLVEVHGSEAGVAEAWAAAEDVLRGAGGEPLVLPGGRDAWSIREHATRSIAERRPAADTLRAFIAIPLGSLRCDPETRRLVREGVPGEVSSFDLRALGAALALRAVHGGEVVALSMGPPGARDGLVECLALGADRALHLLDPLLAGSDTLATARALAAVLAREQPDLVLFGRASTDAETGQVGPEVAEMLDLPQVTAARRLALDPAARPLAADRQPDEGFETVTGPLPAVVTAAEDLAEERFPTKAERQAAAARPIATLGAAEVGLAPDDVGATGSPTWVAGIEHVPSTRRSEMLAGDSPEALARALGERLRQLAPPRDDRPALPARGVASGAPVWVVAEMGPRGPKPVTAELLAKAAELATRLHAPVEAPVLGEGAQHAAALAAAGADRVLLAEGAGLVPYTTDAHAAVLAEAIRTRAPRLVLVASTARGRDLAPRVAARLGLGLTGDAIDLDLDAEGRVRQMKPAFGGAIVAPILSRTRPEMATVRPGILRAARPDPARRAAVERLPVPGVPARVRVVEERPLGDAAGAALEAADLVLGVGRGICGPAALPAIPALAARPGAAVAAPRGVTALGRPPEQPHVGPPGRAIAPRLYVAIALSGAPEHMVGLRRAGVIVAINKNPKAPIFKAADLGIVSDYAPLLPLLEGALRGS